MSAQRQAFEAWWAVVTAQGNPLRRPQLMCETFVAGAEWQALISQQAPVSAEAPIWTDEIITKIYVDAVGHELKHSRARLWDLFSAIESHVRLAIAQSRAQVVPAEPEAIRLAYKTGYDEGYADGSDGMVDHDACEEGWQQYRETIAAPAVSEPADTDLGLMASLVDILDGKDRGDGVSVEPWESLRRRVLELMAAAPSAPAEQGEE